MNALPRIECSPQIVKRGKGSKEGKRGRKKERERGSLGLQGYHNFIRLKDLVCASSGPSSEKHWLGHNPTTLVRGNERRNESLDWARISRIISQSVSCRPSCVHLSSEASPLEGQFPNVFGQGCLGEEIHRVGSWAVLAQCIKKYQRSHCFSGAKHQGRL